MKGKQYFKKCCQEIGLDCNALFKVGEQNIKHNTAYVYRCGNLKKIPTLIFAVNYFAADDLYIAWDLSAPKAKGKETLKLLKKSVPDYGVNQIYKVKKNIEFSGWGEEIVTAFHSDQVISFLEAVKNKIEGDEL